MLITPPLPPTCHVSWSLALQVVETGSFDKDKRRKKIASSFKKKNTNIVIPRLRYELSEFAKKLRTAAWFPVVSMFFRPFVCGAPDPFGIHNTI